MRVPAGREIAYKYFVKREEGAAGAGVGGACWERGEDRLLVTPTSGRAAVSFNFFLGLLSPSLSIYVINMS